LLVAPTAPTGAQNAPGCTTFAGESLGFGLGLGFLVVGFGRTTGLLDALGRGFATVVAGAAIGLGEVDSAVGAPGAGLAAGAAELTDGATKIGSLAADASAPAAFGLSGPARVPMVHRPPQQSTTTASTEISAMCSGLNRRPGPVGDGAEGGVHCGCGPGYVIASPWW
jgi:hypothetical protein